MTENTNQDITVLMAGNPDAQSGESILLNINQSPLKSEELGRIFYDYITSDYYIELKHGAEYITYTYVMNPAKVHSQDSNRPGVFWIGVTIPRKKQIRNPYDLIIELRDKFQKLYMTQRSDGSYEFHNVPYDVNGFKTIVDKYELVGLQSTYVQMTGEKIQTLSLNSDDGNDSAETKIRKFFDDTQYPELEKYSSVIVAEGIEGVTSIPIGVPRLIEYSVMYDGEKLGEISRKASEFEHKLTKLYYKDINVKFSLSDFAKNNTLQKEDDGSKYKVEKKNETITISVDYWNPEKKQISVVIKDNSEDVEKSFYDSIKLTVNNREKDISYDKDFGYYITLIGEEIDGKIEVIQKDTNDIYNYVKTSQSNDSIIEIEVIEFNKIILSGVPCDENGKKLELEINDKEEPVCIKIGTTYNGGMYGIKIADHDVLKNITQFDIKSYRYVSKERYTDKCEIEPTQYDNTKGVLGINLKGFKKVSDNKQTDGNIPNQQTGSDEPTTDNKHTIKVYNEIENLNINLIKLCVNDNIIKKDEVKIYNTKSVNGNKPFNYEEFNIEEEPKKILIEFKLRKSNDGNSKNNKSNEYKEQNKFVAEIKKDKNSTEVYIKEENKTENKHVIKATKENDIFKISTEEANTEGGKNIWCNIKNIFKRKGKGKEDNDIKTENADNGGVEPKKSELRSVFRCLLFWLISLIIAFVFGLIVENQRDVLPLKNIFKNNTRSEKSGGRFGCSRKAAEEKEKFAEQISEYLKLLQNCDENLTFDTVTYIDKYCDSVNNSGDSENKYITENAKFDTLKSYIDNFSKVAEYIKCKKFDDLISCKDDLSKKLKENIAPLLPCDGNNNDNCEKYGVFVELIKNNSINISNITGFAGVLKLYSDSESIINGKIENDKQLVNQKLALIGECNNYYNHMKNCDKDFTFEMVYEIYNWVNDTTNKHLIEDDNNFTTIKKFIPYYKDAADAIKSINVSYTTTEWFDPEKKSGVKVLYDCYIIHTPYEINGFNNEFRNMIEYLLGACGTYKLKDGEGADKLLYNKTSADDNTEKKVKEINFVNQSNKLIKDVKYAKLDDTKYDKINDLLSLANKGEIKSFRDLKQ